MLVEQGVHFIRRDYFKERFTVAELRDLLRGLRLRPADVLSRRAKAYGELVADRELSDEELLALLVQEPTLLRRPLAAKDGRATVGFDRAGLLALVYAAEE